MSSEPEAQAMDDLSVACASGSDPLDPFALSQVSIVLQQHAQRLGHSRIIFDNQNKSLWTTALSSLRGYGVVHRFGAGADSGRNFGEAEVAVVLAGMAWPGPLQRETGQERPGPCLSNVAHSLNKISGHPASLDPARRAVVFGLLLILLRSAPPGGQQKWKKTAHADRQHAEFGRQPLQWRLDLVCAYRLGSPASNRGDSGGDQRLDQLNRSLTDEGTGSGPVAAQRDRDLVRPRPSIPTSGKNLAPAADARSARPFCRRLLPNGRVGQSAS